MENFSYSPEEDVNFTSYFRRYEEWLEKVRFLRKLSPTKPAKFINYILPRKASEFTFTEAVELLMKLFSPKISLFHKRWRCLNLTGKEREDYTTFAPIVNKYCDDFRLVELSADNFKCLIFAQGLLSTKDAEIMRRIINNTKQIGK